MSLRTPCVLCLTLLLSLPVQAFGPHGHQTVGGIADQLLAGSNTAKKVRAILGSNLQMAAVWADCAKGVGQAKVGAPFVYDGSGPYPECTYYENPASQKAMEDFVRRNATHCYANSSDEVCRHKSYHYTDVAIQRDHYAKGLAGTSDHDLISAMQACITVLQGAKSPAPFQIASKKEALRLLAHYLGDVHQPLHVVSIYLDAAGHAVDPDAAAGLDPKTSTKGGNTLLLGASKLHGLWDSIPGSLATDLLAGAGVAAARAVPASAGELAQWPTAWATDTVMSGKPALAGLSFGPKAANGSWPATAAAGYCKERAALQKQQIIKAGARLAELLRAIWP
ncbi:S1/P1 nuclease [Paucibacter sp. KCTC 42545]|uniref:S1/P1 nuclease n=1 Tax=Paucibacter sp. KCTC 42545 TaxID=1768242 RepID=UPI000733BCA6|nr:S1/P1 nuclease [Paucibacter sp. KCTC 42545]ALT78351.1 hypothetical protein AT984_15305 [Paucibacter sp. KCTC 42545]